MDRARPGSLRDAGVRARRAGWRRLVAAAALIPAALVPIAACAWATQAGSVQAGAVQTGVLDTVHSHFVFELRTRWGQPIQGVFPRHAGEVVALPDGRHEVRVRLVAGDVVVEASERYTRFARGERFLDAARHPWLEFRSEPYATGLLAGGGALPGTLTLRGVSRREVFRLEPGACARPAWDCDVVAHATVRRSDYGLQSWRWALRDDVRFHLRVRFREAAP